MGAMSWLSNKYSDYRKRSFENWQERLVLGNREVQQVQRDAAAMIALVEHHKQMVAGLDKFKNLIALAGVARDSRYHRVARLILWEVLYGTPDTRVYARVSPLVVEIRKTRPNYRGLVEEYVTFLKSALKGDDAARPRVSVRDKVARKELPVLAKGLEAAGRRFVELIEAEVQEGTKLAARYEASRIFIGAAQQIKRQLDAETHPLAQRDLARRLYAMMQQRLVLPIAKLEPFYPNWHDRHGKSYTVDDPEVLIRNWHAYADELRQGHNTLDVLKKTEVLIQERAQEEMEKLRKMIRGRGVVLQMPRRSRVA